MIDVRGLVGDDGGGERAGTPEGARPPLPEVFAELAPRLRRLAARRVGEDLADDVVQETFLRAHRAYDRYVDDGRSWAWIRNIAEHVCIDLVRRSRVEAAAVERVSSYRYASCADETFASVEAHEDRVAMAAVLAQLQPRQRRVLVLRDFHGWSTHEVATALGMTIDGVKATLKRARGSFRTAYAGLSGGRYVAGVLGAIAAVRRALRRTTAATGSVNAVLVSALAVVTLTLSLPIVPFDPEVDAVRDGVARSTSSSAATGARAPVGHGHAGGFVRSPFGSGLDVEPDPVPPSGGGLDGTGSWHDGAVAPPGSGSSVVTGGPTSVDGGDAAPDAGAAPPSLEVGAELSPTCDLVPGVNGAGDIDETCAPLDQNVKVPMSPPADSDSAPRGPALPLALAPPETATPRMATPTAAPSMNRNASTSLRVSSDPADDTLEASPAEAGPVIEETLAELSLPA